MLTRALSQTVLLGLSLLLSVQSSANESLLSAAALGDVEQVQSLLAEGVSVHSTLSDGTTALHQAVLEDQSAVVNSLLKAKANPNHANRYAVVPLHIAALNGNQDILAALLKSGANVHTPAATGETPLMIAVQTGRPEVISLLLDAGADVNAKENEFNQSALMMAVRANQLIAVEQLLRHGAEVNVSTRVGPTPKFVPPCKGTGCGSEGVGINRGGLPDHGRRDSIRGGMTALLYAARDGLTEVATLLIAAGADLEQREANGMTPLLLALNNNQLGVAEALLDAGANVNVDDFWGRTPLWAAVEYRNLDMNNRQEDSPTSNKVDRAAILPMIKRLLDAGANVNAQTREVPPPRKWLYSLNDVSWVDYTGQTAFLRAAFSGDTESMRLLLSYGADPNLATHAGTTPLMAAAGVGWVVAQTYTESMAGLLEAIQICLDHGADINAVNSMGLSALLGAANKGANEIIVKLVDNGARLDVVDVEGRDVHRWAQGVFLAAVGAEYKPHTLELLDDLVTQAASE